MKKSEKGGKMVSSISSGQSSSSSGHGSEGGLHSPSTSTSSSGKSSTAGAATRLMEKAEVRRVRETGDWSSNSKLSSICNGYWEDPFFRFFNPNDPAKIRRTSLICRGYYVRFRVCDYFLRNLIKAVGKPVQIVSLGCGMDTCYFRILPELEMKISKFFEVDFKTVVKAKTSVIAHNQVLRVMAEEKLKLLACDLRYIVSLHDTLKENGFDFNKPTIFYSECVVNYLGPNETTNILEWITTNVPNSIWLAYEQCNALDGFGQIMLSHFLKNGCPLLSLISAHTQKDQEIQLRNAGFKISQVVNAWDAFVKIGNSHPPHFPRLKNTDHQFDEYEQLIATCLHYSIRIGLHGKMCHNSKITDLLELFHMHLIPMLKQPGVSHQLIKDSGTLKLDTISGMYLPTLTGHKTAVISTSPNTLLTLGGSGENSVRMKHLIRTRICFESNQHQSTSSAGDPFDEDDACSTSTNPSEADMAGSVGQLTVRSRILLENSDHYERIHACAVFVPASVKSSESHDSVLIFGGRRSPKSPCPNDLIELNVNKIGSNVNIASVIVSAKFDGNYPQSRWRHDMSLCCRKGVAHVLLFGGMIPEAVLGDCWWYNVDDFAWTQIHPASSTNLKGTRTTVLWPGARHSHTLTSDVNGSTIYMIGGISENDTTLCDDAFWIFDAESEKWTNLEDWDALARRVGHSTVKCKNLLIIVGGYGADSSYGFDFLAAICDLERNVVEIVTQTLPLSDIYLPFGFTASLLHDTKTDKDKIVIFGGGGNCFSFGTHYNQVCYVYTINQ